MPTTDVLPSVFGDNGAREVVPVIGITPTGQFAATMTDLVDVFDTSPSGSLIVGGRTPRLTASMTRAASGTQYSVGDALMNTETAASAVPLTWDVGSLTSGRVTGARCVVAAASGTVVLAALDVDLYLFRPATGVPFAAASYPADNAAVNFTAAAMRECIGIIRLASAGWVNNVGTNAAAGGFLYQASALTTVSSRPYAPFNLTGLSATTIIGVPVMRGAWNPGNVAQQIDVTLDMDLD